MDFLPQHLPGLCKTPGIQGQTQMAVSFLICLSCSVPTYCKITLLCAVELINSIMCSGTKAVEKILDKQNGAKGVFMTAEQML